eukprot:2307476-Amphidinium_carterae.1
MERETKTLTRLTHTPSKPKPAKMIMTTLLEYSISVETLARTRLSHHRKRAEPAKSQTHIGKRRESERAGNHGP